MATIVTRAGKGSALTHAEMDANLTNLNTDKAETSHTHTASAISDSTSAGRSMLTAADAAAQTALLDAVTSGAKGLAPASGGGTTNFLRADGTWAAPTASAAWGGITGTLSSQADLQSALDAKQPLDADLTALAAAGNSAVLAATTASFLTADETKLDGIEALADVTDTANVTAAGALMDSEVASLSGIKTLTVPDSTTISAFGATLVDDADASAARTTLGLVIGTNVQAYDADTAKLDVAQSFTAAQGVTPVALSDGANIATDCSLSNNFTVTLGGNRTLDNPTNIVAGRTYTWAVTQDGTPPRTLAFGSYFDFPGGTAPTLSTGAGDVDLIVGHAISTTRLLCVANLDFS